jgi:hypothetical protein
LSDRQLRVQGDPNSRDEARGAVAASSLLDSLMPASRGAELTRPGTGSGVPYASVDGPAAGENRAEEATEQGELSCLS